MRSFFTDEYQNFPFKRAVFAARLNAVDFDKLEKFGCSLFTYL
ncbi:MAG TPA: hypothetical protein V6D06_10305 [Trichocoleus sp.]